MAVTVGEQFVGAFARGVQRNRLIDRIVFCKRHLGIGAIHRTARCIDQVLWRVTTARFQNVEKPDQIRLRIGIRIVQRVAHSGLRSEVNDLFVVAVFEQRGQSALIDNVQPLERKIDQRLQSLQTRLFEFDVVIRIEIVDTHNL